MRPRHAALIAGLALIASCDRRPKPKAVGDPVYRDADVTDALAAQLAAANAPLDVGPVGDLRPRAERERAVWALVNGEPSPLRLPEVGTDEGKTLNLLLRDQLSPSTQGLAGLGLGPRGAANVGSVAVTGEVANAARVVAGMRAGLRACYNRGLAEHPGTSGNVHVTALVGEGGEVTSVQLSATGNLPAMVKSCIKARVTAAQFDAQKASKVAFQVKLALQE